MKHKTEPDLAELPAKPALPWRRFNPDDPKSAPPRNIWVLTHDDLGRISCDVWTGSTFYPGNPGAIVSHWLALHDVPKPAAAAPQSQISNLKSQI